MSYKDWYLLEGYIRILRMSNVLQLCSVNINNRSIIFVVLEKTIYVLKYFVEKVHNFAKKIQYFIAKVYSLKEPPNYNN